MTGPKRNGARADGPRLRFDRVATRLLDRLRDSLRKAVPGGATVLVTVTAPIRLASKTAAELEEKIQTLLRRGSPGRDRKYTIHGNRVRIRVVKHGRARSPKFLGFVHNSESDARQILDTASASLE